MTKENFTSINVIIDQSGSMAPLSKDTIGGFNKFLAEQKDVPGDAELTLCLFSTDYRLVHDCVKLSNVPELNEQTYRPGGGTALLDAVGATIDNVGKKLANTSEEERPSKIIFLIITDGDENSSKVYHELDRVKNMVSHQRDKYKWEFVFMGANIDAVSAGTSLGVSAQNSVNYIASAAGTASLYKGVSKSMTRYRSAPESKFKVDLDNNKLDSNPEIKCDSNKGNP